MCIRDSFAFSLDGAPVEIIDLARGERLPPWLVQAITSPEYIKQDVYKRQGSERYEAADAAVDNRSSAVDALDEAISSIESAQE